MRVCWTCAPEPSLFSAAGRLRGLALAADAGDIGGMLCVCATLSAGDSFVDAEKVWNMMFEPGAAGGVFDKGREAAVTAGTVPDNVDRVSATSIGASFSWSCVEAAEKV